LPKSKFPINLSNFPFLIFLSIKEILRKTSSISPIVNSATALVGASGVFFIFMPNSLATDKLMPSIPTPHLEIIFKNGLAISSTLRLYVSVPAIIYSGLCLDNKEISSSSLSFLLYGFIIYSKPAACIRLSGSELSSPNDEVVIRIVLPFFI